MNPTEELEMIGLMPRALLARPFRVLWRAMLATLLLIPLAGCLDEAFMAGSIRYKLSMTLQVDDRLVTASAIQEVGYFDLPPWMLTHSRDDFRVRGNVIAVDLGDLGSIFVRLATGYGVPDACAVTRRDADTLSAWFERLRPRLKLCDGIQSPYTAKPEFLVAPPYSASFPQVVEDRELGAPIAPGFEVFRWGELSQAFQGRVKLVRAWYEPTEDPFVAASFSLANWLRPLFDGSVPFFNAATSHGGYSTFRRIDFARDSFGG